MSSKQAASQVASALRERGFQALFAGGCVRDELLGLQPKDFDIATNATPDDVAKLFPRAQLVGAAFGVVVINVGGRQIEVATFREDGRYLDSRHPETVTFGSVETDARRRDFTINGMFMDPVDGKILDQVGGRADLSARLIRAIGDADQRFAEDRLRLLRAVRFAARFEFEIEPKTLAAIGRHAPELPRISTERIRMELEMILSHPSRARAWLLLKQCGLLDVIVPGFRWSGEDVAGVGIRIRDLAADCPWPTPLAVLFHAVGAKEAGDACRRLTCSNEVIKTVTWQWETVRTLLSGRSLELADLCFLRADDRTPGACQMLHAELAALNLTLDVYDRWVAELERIDPATALPPPLISGHDLMHMGIPPGAIYSTTLDAVYRAQLNEKIGTRDEALSMARSIVASGGPRS